MSHAAPRPIHEARSPLLGPIGLRQYVAMHLTSAGFPAAAGAALFGWRALASMGIVIGSTLLASAIWRRVGRRGPAMRLDHAAYLALLLALALPAHLLTTRSVEDLFWPWTILPTAGIALAALMWLLGGPGSGRVHPVLVVYLLMVVLFQHALVPHRTLEPGRLVLGDVLNAPPGLPAGPNKEPWIRASATPPHHAVVAEPASQRLVFYTSGRQFPDRQFISLDGLIRDRMPPLEDLVIGGQPAPMGQSSAIALIIGGLFLVYRGLIDFRIPLAIMVSAWVALLVLPIPVAITTAGPEWRWLALRDPGVGWATALTFANYSLLASPLLFIAFFLAPAASIRPLPRAGRLPWAILIGIVSAATQLYASVSFGPYIALLLASLLTPLLDRWWKPRTLV